MRKKLFRNLTLLGLTLFLSVSGSAGERLEGRYFMVMYGYQGVGNRAVDSHTFAAFYDGYQLSRGRISYPATISWLPASGIVRPVRKERGRNFSLEETLAIATQRHYQVQAQGPFEITPSLYQRALRQIEILNSGAYFYRMIALPGSPVARNCIESVSDIQGPLTTGTAWGYAASNLVLQHLSTEVYQFPSINITAARILSRR